MPNSQGILLLHFKIYLNCIILLDPFLHKGQSSIHPQWYFCIKDLITKIRPANIKCTGKNSVIVTFALLMHQNPVHIIKKVKKSNWGALISNRLAFQDIYCRRVSSANNCALKFFNANFKMAQFHLALAITGAMKRGSSLLKKMSFRNAHFISHVWTLFGLLYEDHPFP